MRLGFAAAGLCAACLVGASAPGALCAQGGERADYDWELRTLEGEPVRLEAYRGRVLFINMWATWCAPCVAEMAGIEALRRSLHGSGVVFLLISPEDPEPVERFLRRYGYDLPVLLEHQEAPAAFRLRALPTTWVVDRDGRIVLSHRGAAEWNRPEILELLRSLAATAGSTARASSRPDTPGAGTGWPRARW